MQLQFVPRKNSTNNRKIADGGICTLSKKSLEKKNHKIYRKDSEAPPGILRNVDQGCLVVKLFPVELNACWFLVPIVIPAQGSDQRNHLECGAHVKMDSLEPDSPSPANSFNIDVQKSQTNDHQPDHTCAKPITSTSSYVSNGPEQSQSRGSLNRRTKVAIVSNSCSQQDCDLSNDFSGLRHKGHTGTGSADLVKDIAKIDKPLKKISRKKSRKKGRKQKKAVCNSETTTASEQGIHGISTLDTCSNSGSALGDGCSLDNDLSENATPFSVSPQGIITSNFYDEESSNDTTNLSATSSKAATSCSDDVELLERAASLPQGSAGDDFGFNQLCVNETSRSVTTNTMHTRQVTLSDFNGVLLDAHLKQNATLREITSGSSSEEHSAPVVDSFFDGWNSDGSEPPIRKEIGVHPKDTGTSYYSNNGAANDESNLSNAVVNTKNNSDRTGCGNQGDTCSSGSSSGDGFTVISRKKGRQSRKSWVSANGKHRVSSEVDVHSRLEKESNLSFLWRVRKTVEDESFFVSKDIDPVGSRVDASNDGSLCAKPDAFVDVTAKVDEKSSRSAWFDEISAQGDTHRRSPRADVNASSLKSECGGLKKIVSEKSRRPSSESMQVSIHKSRNSHTGKATSIRSTKMNVPRDEAFGTPLAGNNYSRCDSGSTSSSCFSTDSFNSSSSEPLEYSEICPEKARLLGSVIAVGSDVNAQASHKQSGTLSAVSDSLVQPAVEFDSRSKLSMDKPGDSCIHLGNEKEPAELETYVSKVKNSKPDYDSGLISQKWIPLGRKANGTFDHFSVSHLDEKFSHGPNLNSTEEEQLRSLPSSYAGLTRLGSSSGSANCTLSKDEVPTELGCVHIPSVYQPIHRSYKQDISVDQTVSSHISQAINDAYRMQIESEGIQLATGSPLAEFEKLLLSASPVLDQTCSIQHCNDCFGDQIGDFLCRHQLPNVTLGSLWQWYDMIGSYGLEVKVEDCYSSNLKRFGGDQFQFHAYFVPFLSAVQLFGHTSNSNHASNVMPNTDFTNTRDLDATSEYSSHFGSHHAFSVASPQSRRMDESDLSLPSNFSSTSDSLSASGQGEVCKQLLSSCISDPELLFEYFESEPPQQRRPLFEKIQELVRGNASSNSQIFGEAWKLAYLHLHDLHPSSWYSVAWYPIYRIPDGNFRAAFLTYHSLGHFVRRSASSASTGGDASIVSPIVGLQSYNAQDECWFRPKNPMMVQMEGSPCSNPSEVLKERLRTLEQTAHVMARASFLRGNRKFVNRQPDYEFFLSRRR